ncbi:MAG: transcriptional regulator, partial [Verrucomicrobia bacterium]|nr:transcriptional regulator [Verrucomicrobiota bacterium]
GEGGLVTTKDADLAEKVRKLRVHGAKVKYFHEMIGGNFRLHELQAAFLRVKLRHLDQALKKRRENAEKLIHVLQEKWKAVFSIDQCVCEGESRESARHPAGTVLLPFSCQKGPAEHTWNQFVIRVVGEGRRDEWRNKLALDGFQTEIYYPRSMHEQACFAGQETIGKYPMAERLTAESLALPLRFDPGIA